MHTEHGARDTESLHRIDPPEGEGSGLLLPARGCPADAGSGVSRSEPEEIRERSDRRGGVSLT